MHANFSTCGWRRKLWRLRREWRLRGSRLGALAVPGALGRDDRVLRLDRLYKTLECGGDVRAAIKAQVDGDEKHVRVAGVGYFIGIYLFKQVDAAGGDGDWSCPRRDLSWTTARG